MAFELCRNGHYFDSAKHGRCPFCPAGGKTFDPPVGWMVIVAGPNLGADFTIHPGGNAIGRAPAAIALDMDPLVVENHLSVFYESRSNRFVLRPGTSSVRSYINGAPVESGTDLRRGDRLRIGNTTLLFVPLAGEHFEWPARLFAI